MRGRAKTELVLLALALACLAVAALHQLTWVDLRGISSLGLYGYYAAAAIAGWVLGNVYVHRARDSAARKLLAMGYLLSPLPPLFVLRLMAPADAQEAAPLVPLFGCGVYAIFFSVPVSLRAVTPERRRLELGHPDDDRP